MRSNIKHRLSPDEQLVYLHIPKTAGTTFSAVLDGLFRPEEVIALYSVHFGDLTPDDLAPYRCIRGHFFRNLIAPLIPRQPTYITFLRDPVECALSHYGHIQRRPPVPKYAVGHGLDLEEYLYHPLAYHRVANLQSRWLSAPMYFDPLLDHRTRVSQAQRYEEAEAIAGKWPPAERAMRVLDAMPFFGLVERFEDSMALFTYTFSFAPIQQVERKNTARVPRPQREQVAPRLLDRLHELNQEDAALYAYAQRLFAARYNRMLVELLDAARHPDQREPAALVERAPVETRLGEQ